MYILKNSEAVGSLSDEEYKHEIYLFNISLKMDLAKM